MGELAEASGVSAATIKHYLREGLLPEPVKTSRNMAYYPAEFVDRIQLIKQLQEERYMPLRVIKDLLEEDPERAKALIELGDRLLERVLAGEQERVSAAEVRHRYDVPQEVLDRLAELEVLTPDKNGYSPSDVRIIEAISRFRAGGYDERIGFTVYDTLRYKEAMAELVKRGGRRADGAPRRRDGRRPGDGADRGRLGAAERADRPRCTPRRWSPSSSAAAAPSPTRTAKTPASSPRWRSSRSGCWSVSASWRWCVRVAIQVSRTGRTGLIGVRRGVGPLDWLAADPLHRRDGAGRPLGGRSCSGTRWTPSTR